MQKSKIVQELQFKAVRSSGAGGQHVNKVSSKIELSFDLLSSDALSDAEKERIIKNLGNRLTKENVLLLQCEESRSQHKNKDLAVKRLLKLLEKALIVPKKRRKTKPTKSAIENRLKTKKKAAEKKINRSKPKLD